MYGGSLKGGAGPDELCRGPFGLGGEAAGPPAPFACRALGGLYLSPGGWRGGYPPAPGKKNGEVTALAVTRIALDSRLQARYQTGVNGDGEPVYSTRNLGSVKAESDDQSLWAVATVIAGLQQYPLAEVRRVDYGIITETP